MKKDLKKELLAGEQWDNASPYKFSDRQVYGTVGELANAFMQPAGQFLSPLTRLERWKLRVYRQIGTHDPLALQRHFFYGQTYSLSPAWQILLEYLWTQNVISEPKPKFDNFPHDSVKGYAIQLDKKVSTSDASSSDTHYFGYGAATQKEMAISKAVGELLERFALQLYNQNRPICGSVAEFSRTKRKFLDPGALDVFAPWQKKHFKHLGWDDRTQFYWTDATRFDTGEKILIPAQTIFLTYGTSRDQLLREPNSSGGAGHFTLEEAILSGIYEAVERDGFLIFWLNNISPPVIDQNTIQSQELHELLANVQRYGYEVYFLNTTTELAVPSCACVLVDRSRAGPCISTGGGAGYDIEHMLLTSLHEALHASRLVHNSNETFALTSNYQPFIDQSIHIDSIRRLLIWKNTHMYEKIVPFLKGEKQTIENAFGPVRKFTSSQEELNYLCRSLEKHGRGYETYVYEAKHPVLEKLGYRVVKTVTPALTPLYLSEFHIPLGVKRLYSVPPKLGFEVAQEWNPWPHPFP